jgi:aspartyl-tRNA(Asn)/glutamyl-tRNA(Gln) amidotransferase subunit A
VAVKDNISTVDYPTTCTSRMLTGYRSGYDAAVVRRLRAAGAVISADQPRRVRDGISTENSAFGPTRNLTTAPVPGGSSGGSAAAVAAGLVPAALGSETSGSIRQPAAFCGVVGLRPTYGRVSRYGVVAFSSSLDQVGPITADVRDAALLLKVLAGRDPRDATSVERPGTELEDLGDAATGLVVGVPAEYFPPELDAGVARLCHAALDRLRAMGAEVRAVSLPHAQAIPPVRARRPGPRQPGPLRWGAVRRARGDAASIRGCMRRAARAVRPEVKRRIVLGSYVSRPLLRPALCPRAGARPDRSRFQQVFAAGVDVIFSPTAPTRVPVRGRPGIVRILPFGHLRDALQSGALPSYRSIGRLGSLPVGGQFISALARGACCGGALGGAAGDPLEPVIGLEVHVRSTDQALLRRRH